MKKKPHKILIIKLGYSETLIPDIGRTCSFGDVFRTTVLLHLFKEDHVTWLTDISAFPLLEDNPYIDRTLSFDLINVLQLESERFDKVINLEKVPGICAMVDKISAWSHYGFRFDQETGKAESYELAYEALAVATREDVKKLNNKSWAEVLYEMLGSSWQGESYILGYKPKSDVQFDIGFNSHVGKLIPAKAWPEKHWQELERLVRGKFSVTYQQHLDNLHGYIEWINTCRILVTNDSLGFYLATVLGKKVIGLFGPTSHTEQSPHPNVTMFTPAIDRDCIPCFKRLCEHKDSCINYISPQIVYEKICSLS